MIAGFDGHMLFQRQGIEKYDIAKNKWNTISSPSIEKFTPACGAFSF